MEFKNFPIFDGLPLFSIKWDSTSKDYRNEIATVWQGNQLKIKLHSFVGFGPIGQRLNVDFTFNDETYSVKILNSYMKGKRGEIPDLKSDTHRLIFKLTSGALEVYEKQLSFLEIQNQKETALCLEARSVVIPNKPIQGDFNEYDFRTNPNVSWIMVSENLSTLNFSAPVSVPSTMLWVKKVHQQNYNPNVTLYKYEFFSKFRRPISLEMNNYICKKAYDVCNQVDRGIQCTLMFEITDRNNVTRTFDSKLQGAEGIVQILKFMHMLSEFQDFIAVDLVMDVSAN